MEEKMQNAVKHQSYCPVEDVVCWKVNRTLQVLRKYPVIVETRINFITNVLSVSAYNVKAMVNKLHVIRKAYYKPTFDTSEQNKNYMASQGVHIIHAV